MNCITLMHAGVCTVQSGLLCDSRSCNSI